MAGLTQQQELAVASLAGRILVSAGAGSGKTHVLVERYIERLKRDANLGVGSLIAVTFTRKAANEMRIRLKKRLRELHESSPPEDRERWGRCLSEIDGARIGTIHSLCETIIKTFPLDAGVDPQLAVLDDLGQARLIHESTDRAFREVIEEQSPEHELMLEYDMQQIRQWLTAVLKSSLQFQEAVADVSGLSAAQLVDYAGEILRRARWRALKKLLLAKTFSSALSALENVSSESMTTTLNEFRLAAVSFARMALDTVAALADAGPAAAANTCSAGSGDERLVQAWAALFELSQLKTGNTGGNKDDAKLTRAAIKTLREISRSLVEKIPSGLNDVDPKAFDFASHFLSLAERARSAYAAFKRERFTADYNDLIALALCALEKEGSAARRFYNGVTAEIMVDEFQDTNRVQSALLALLAGPKTTMFLIGDDKQSIYKFQGADVSTFNEWKRRVAGKDEGSLLSLSLSFRSHPEIVRFVNAFFGVLMGDESQAGLFDASFQSLQAARCDADNAVAQRVEVICYSDGGIDAASGRAEQNRRAEAKAVADYIAAKIEADAVVHERAGSTRPIRYGDFAVLVQRNRDFAWIERALIKGKIPYVMMGGRNFLERQEIYDLENMLSFLASPLNDHALIGVLRSPMFAVGDDLLQGLSGGRASGASLWQAMLAVAKNRKPGYEPVRRAVALIKQLLADASRLQLSELLRKIIERTGYDLILLGLPNGRQRSRNLWKLVAMACQKEELSCAEFAESLRLMREYNVQQADAALDTSDSVKLMTIHGSKGLEFPAVLLPVLDAGSLSRYDRVLFHREYGIAFNTARIDSDAKPAYYQVACAINEEMELAEKKRLFYVAATRARDYLGLFFNADARNLPSFRTWLREWLGLNDRDSEEGASLNRQEQYCSLSFTEVLDDEEPTLPVSPESEPPSLKTNWELIWPTMDGEVEAPPPNPGVRITRGQSRQRLEATAIGTVFHALMENLPGDLAVPDEKLLEAVAFAHGDVVADAPFKQELLKEARSLVGKFFDSELYLNLKSAKRRFHEFPYVMAAGADSVQQELEPFDEQTAAVSVVLRRPDLIYEDHHGRWHVVDYKTDRITSEEIASHIVMHGKQIKQYVQELRALTGLDFIASIYFAHLGVLSSIPAPALAR